VHPGVVDTNLARNVGPVLAAIKPLFLKSVGEGAATEVFASTQRYMRPCLPEVIARELCASVRRPIARLAGRRVLR
jgi:hypothetical protein